MKRPLTVLVCAGLLQVGMPAAKADTLVGRVSDIDADTIEIHDERIRRLDIDAPESRQQCTARDGSEWRCGQKAPLALADWIGARAVTCETDTLDRYGRHLARCSVGGQDLGAWLAESGWAVPYHTCKCEAIRDAANGAKAAQLGIWSGTLMMPWDWRKAH